ncbi:MAG: (2Fe-2S)-binding protein [Clostridiaceae bacterium]
MESINDCSRSFPANVTDQAISNKCPVCDNNGLAVSKVTVNHLVEPTALAAGDGDDYFICMNANCDVIYFDPTTKIKFMKNQVIVPIWFKQGADPKYACYCSEVTEDQVIVAVVVHGAKTVKEVNALTGAMRNSNCLENNPLGVCCHQIIQGVIDQALAEKS